MSSFKPYSTILGRLNRSPAEVLYDSHQQDTPSSKAPSRLDDVTPAAAGDLSCSKCLADYASGTTGMYEVEGRVLCAKCAIKQLGLEGLPGTEQNYTLRRFLKLPK